MFIYKLSQLPDTTELHFGGKATSLCTLLQNHIKVPFGYAIAAEAFRDGELCSQACEELNILLKHLPCKYTYAVRSSAVGEDGLCDSFAGAYETVLDVSPDEILDAVQAVAQSAKSERVSAYGQNRNAEYGQIAVVIQRFIKPEFAGVLFTADTITASTGVMVGNYVKGVGETLVSGAGMDGDIRFHTVKYAYEGPDEFKLYARKLYDFARKIVKVYGCPQDIEWAVYNGKVYILQARPITTLHKNKPEEFLFNDSLCEELLLSKTNVGEIFLRPVSPATYGILCHIKDSIGIPLISNVCGQLYLNISGLCSLLVSFGFTKERAYNVISELAGGIPDNLDIPIYPFDRNRFLKQIKSILKGAFSRKSDNYDFGKNFKNRIAEIGLELSTEIREKSTKEELNALWETQCMPYMTKTFSAIMTGLSVKTLFSTREKLVKVCGAELTDRLLSDCSENGNIESIGTLLALDDVLHGKMSKEDYVARYGHRHADEMELSMPYPYEDPGFPDNVIEDYKNSGINAYDMKAKQEQRRKESIEEFIKQYPAKKAWLKRLLKKYSSAVYSREKIRSDALRLFCVIREYLLKAGELTGMEEDIFLLYMEEVQELLAGQEFSKELLKKRRINYRKQLEMPHFPSIICGRFDVEEWKQSGAVSGYYRFGESNCDECTDVIAGVAGSCGQAEGIARVLSAIDEADSLVPGEILVVPAANIGWVKLFPKVSAIVTDIGAPLSHAVIVARELGIPAVVSCQNASGILKTGDRIKVDGTAGKVILLDCEQCLSVPSVCEQSDESERC